MRLQVGFCTSDSFLLKSMERLISNTNSLRHYRRCNENHTIIVDKVALNGLLGVWSVIERIFDSFEA
jgi:hypothetical protein